ncbi:MAG TPA: dipeptidase [Phycisphaerae bacterium]|nr:dipeptidase [Phycisphaerae bacterium]
MHHVEQAIEYVHSRKQALIDSWLELVRVPSVSAQPEHAGDMAAAAQWLEQRLGRSGFDCRICDSGGHPAVFAGRCNLDGALTVLVYGHYDVQPPGDQRLWDSPPFKPAVRDGAVFGRGAADDKGQLLTAVAAVEAWQAVSGELPVNVKFLLEGEEEIGSPHLPSLVESHQNELACDVVLICDTAAFKPGVPAITYGTKGLVYKEVTLTGPAKDLHSGSFGGTVANPANVLAEVIASLKDADGRVTIPGFYDDVQPLGEAERASLAALRFDEVAYLAQLGSPALAGEPGCSTLERRWTRPTLDVNGLSAGYQGQGASTIIPARASAKISMRLVPRQDPEAVSASFNRVVRQVCGDRVRAQITEHGLCRPYMAPLDSPWMGAARRALAAGFGREPVLIREGGTLPILPVFKEVLGADCLLLGYCRPDCNAHGPNEFFHIEDFLAGAVTGVRLLAELAGLYGPTVRG